VSAPTAGPIEREAGWREAHCRAPHDILTKFSDPHVSQEWGDPPNRGGDIPRVPSSSRRWSNLTSQRNKQAAFGSALEWLMAVRVNGAFPICLDSLCSVEEPSPSIISPRSEKNLILGTWQGQGLPRTQIGIELEQQPRRSSPIAMRPSPGLASNVPRGPSFALARPQNPGAQPRPALGPTRLYGLLLVNDPWWVFSNAGMFRAGRNPLS